MYVRGTCSWHNLIKFKFAPAFFLALSILVCLNKKRIYGLNLRTWILPVACGGLLASLAVRGRFPVPLMAGLGKCSYSIYLMHPIALALLFYLPAYAALPSFVVVPLSTIIAILFSWCFYWLVERHFISASRAAGSEAKIQYTYV